MCGPLPVPGAASLVESIDKKIMVWLRDGRTFWGHLRTVDQFANLVLFKAFERIHVGQEFGDLAIGILMIRGENVALLGDVDENKETTLIQVDIEEIMASDTEKRKVRKELEALREEAFKCRNMIYDDTLLDLF